ncbi:MAG: cystathionine gamma-synthase [Bacteroidia bacterium]
MRNTNHFGFSTRAIHAGQQPDPTTGSVMTPIYQTSTFAQHLPGETYGGYEYSRTANPTRTALEANLASLEHATYGLCFASGCAALATLLHILKTGDHVVLGDDVYGGTFRIFDKVFKQLDIQYTQVNMSDLSALQNAIRANTKLVWTETPTNPMLKIIDIKNVVDITKKANPNILIAVDNTFATPYLQNPLLLGADIVCHSSTKYLGGHSDVIGGVLVLNDPDLYEQLKFMQNSIGAVPGPQDCFLLLRSTKTLALRLQRHCSNAKLIADFLNNHAKVEQVIYPGLASHPHHALAAKQMKDFGGMISIYLKGHKQCAFNFLQKLQLFTLGESLGGVESLIGHPATMTHAAIPAEQRAIFGIQDNLVRLSVGIEDPEDLIQDLEQAL